MINVLSYLSHNLNKINYIEIQFILFHCVSSVKKFNKLHFVAFGFASTYLAGRLTENFNFLHLGLKQTI